MRIARMLGRAAAPVAAGLLAAACGGNHSATVGASASGTPDAPVAMRVITPAGEVLVAGAIGRKYQDLGGRQGELGLPKGAERDGPDGGRYQEFDGGAVYWTERTGAHVVWGEIRNAWEIHGGAGGGYGYPTVDEHDVAGGKAATFTGGTITWIDGRTTVLPAG